MAFVKTGTATDDWAANSLAFDQPTNDEGPYYFPYVRPGQTNSSGGDYGSGSPMVIPGVGWSLGPMPIDRPTVIPPQPVRARPPAPGEGSYVRIYNYGPTPLFYSFDGGATSARIEPFSAAMLTEKPENATAVAVRGGSNYKIEAWFPPAPPPNVQG